jgi:hypothetical protein
LRTCLIESSGPIYEILDGICAFEVIRIDKTQLLGWRPEVCTYLEEHAWEALDFTNKLEV